MTTKSRLKRLFILFALISIGILIISNMPTQIQQEFSGFELYMTGVDEFEILNPIDININGRLRNVLFPRLEERFPNVIFFRRPHFYGAIELQGHDITLNRSDIGLFFEFPFYRTPDLSSVALLSYRKNIDGNIDIPFSGLIHTDADFSFVLIIWRDAEYAGPRNRVIIAPVADIYDVNTVLHHKGVSFGDGIGVYRRIDFQ